MLIAVRRYAIQINILCILVDYIFYQKLVHLQEHGSYQLLELCIFENIEAGLPSCFGS